MRNKNTGEMTKLILDCLNADSCDVKGENLIEYIDKQMSILVDENSSRTLKAATKSLLKDVFKTAEAIFSNYPKHELAFKNSIVLTRKVKDKEASKLLEDYFDSVTSVLSVFAIEKCNTRESRNKRKRMRYEIDLTKHSIEYRRERFDEIINKSKPSKTDCGKGK